MGPLLASLVPPIPEAESAGQPGDLALLGGMEMPAPPGLGLAQLLEHALPLCGREIGPFLGVDGHGDHLELAARQVVELLDPLDDALEDQAAEHGAFVIDEVEQNRAPLAEVLAQGDPLSLVVRQPHVEREHLAQVLLHRDSLELARHHVGVALKRCEAVFLAGRLQGNQEQRQCEGPSLGAPGERPRHGICASSPTATAGSSIRCGSPACLRAWASRTKSGMAWSIGIRWMPRSGSRTAELLSSSRSRARSASSSGFVLDRTPRWVIVSASRTKTVQRM